MTDKEQLPIISPDSKKNNEREIEIEEINQDPELGGSLTSKQVIEYRKHLSELIGEISKIRREILNSKENKNNANKEDEILKKKKEIDELIDKNKKQ